MSIDDLRLRTKVTIPLSLLALTVLAMAALGASRLQSLSSSASQIIETREGGILQLAAATKAMISVPYSILAGVAYDNDTENAKAAAEDFDNAPAVILGALDQAASLLPEKAAELAKIKERFSAIVPAAKAAFKLGVDAPGADHGRSLKPEELDMMAAAAKACDQVDTVSRALVKDLLALRAQVALENAAAARALNAGASEAVMTLACVGFVCALIAVAFALWMTSAKIAGPLNRLGEQMKKLARGDLTTVVEGADRRDEVGEMAQAVEVFKQIAVERGRAGQAEAATRASAEADRERIAGD